MRRTKMDFYRRSLRTQSPHGLSGSVNREEAHPKSLILSSLLFPLCFLCFLLFQISPLRMRRTKMDFYRRSLRTQSPHGLSGSVNREEAHPKSLILRSLLFPFASFASFCSKSLPSGCGEPRYQARNFDRLLLTQAQELFFGCDGFCHPSRARFPVARFTASSR